MNSNKFHIRSAQDSDVEGLIKLIGGCFAEYEGCVLDLDGIDKPMLAIDSYVKTYDGAFWVVERNQEIVGSVGYIVEERKMELVKLYVNKAERRQGLASELLKLVVDAAQALNIELDLWSDTRFLEAHAFYAAHGFIKQSQTRYLNDPSESTEYHFIHSKYL